MDTPGEGDQEGGGRSGGEVYPEPAQGGLLRGEGPERGGGQDRQYRGGRCRGGTVPRHRQVGLEH